MTRLERLRLENHDLRRFVGLLDAIAAVRERMSRLECSDDHPALAEFLLAVDLTREARELDQRLGLNVGRRLGRGS